MPEEARRSDLYEGTVGWGEDGGNFADLGDGTEPALVNVTLYSGRDRSQPLRSDVAQGTRVRCRIMGPIYYVPPNGTRVMVAIPGDQFQIPGAGVIMGTTGTAPPTQFAKDRVVISFGPKTHVVIEGASVSLQDRPATVPGPRCLLSVGASYTGGPRGVRGIDYQGNGWTVENGVVGIFASSGGDAKSLIQVTIHEIDLLQKGGAFLKLSDDAGGTFHGFGAINKMQGAGCYIGALPLIAAPVLYGVPAAPMASLSVFVSA